LGRRRVRQAREELKMAVNLTLKNFRVLETVLAGGVNVDRKEVVTIQE